MDRLVTAGTLKTTVARLLGAAPVGWFVGVILRHRIPNHGLVFATSDPAFTREVEAQLLFRTYESAEIRMVRRYIHEARFVLDLGSSLGIVASHILQGMSVPGRLICVEANPSLVPSLRRTTGDHSRGQSVDIVEAAVSYGGGPALFRVGIDSVSSHLATTTEGIAIEVQTVTLRTLLDSFGVDEPFTLVTDIEGAEVGLIYSDKEALKECILMIAELHPTSLEGLPISVSDMYQEVLRQGFRLLEQHGPVFVFAR